MLEDIRPERHGVEQEEQEDPPINHSNDVAPARVLQHVEEAAAAPLRRTSAAPLPTRAEVYAHDERALRRAVVELEKSEASTSKKMKKFEV